MFESLSTVRLVPQEKEKTGKIILGFVIVLLLGAIMGISDWIVSSAVSLITDSSNSYVVTYGIDICGLYYGIDLLILFFIAIKSRTPQFSSLHTITFFVGYALSLFFSYFSHGAFNSVDYKNNFIFRIITIAICLVVFMALNYFMWYAKGEGKFANIMSAVAVAGMIILNAFPIFIIVQTVGVHNLLRSDLAYSFNESAYVITGIIVIAILIAFAVLIALNLKSTEKKRKNSLAISIPFGVVFAIVSFLLLNFTSHIPMSPFFF